MTPNFTLSLSFEGIRLLQRVPDGWHLIGEVPLDAPDLGADLAALRKTAMDLAPDGLHTKLLIPNEQIKYTAIDTTRTELADIHAALEGATPYAIADLEIDFDRTGGRTHIAAVARETLVEAEAFATEHKFAPICFAAVAEPLTFRGEVFFGMTELAKSTLAPGTEVLRDGAPVAITGTYAPVPEAVPEVAAEPKTVFDPEPEDEAPEEEIEVVFASRSRGKGAVVTTIEPPQIEPLFTTRKEDPVSAPPVAAPEPVAAAPVAPAAPEKTNLPFGDPKAVKARGKPRFLLPILIGLLLLFMAIVAFWANSLGPDGVAGWFRGAPEEAPVIAAAPDPVMTAPIEDQVVLQQPQAESPVADIPTVTAPIEETAAPLPPQVSPNGTLPIVREATGRVLSPSEAERTYAATGVYQRAPRMPLVPAASTLDGFQQAVAVPAVPTLDNLALPDLALMFPDQVLAPPLSPPPAGTNFPRDIRGFILATPDGTLTPDGVFVIAGAPDVTPPLRPGTQIPAAPVVAEPVLPGQEGLRLVAGRPPIEPPLRPEGLAPVPEPVVADAPEARPEAPVEEGLNLIAGRPPRTPPVRPATFATLAEPNDASAPQNEEQVTELAAVVINPTDALAQGGVALRSVKPTLRPIGFEAPEVLPFASDPALAGLRPSLRPADLAPPAAVEETSQQPDVTSLIAGITAAAPDNPIVTPTARAIVASPRPDTRPRNIATLVANAIARQPSAPATQVSSAPARATGPIPNSVAEAATIDNAIRLRDVNLIGVYGRTNDRRALVRLSNGRYVKVEVGSDLDGGQVTAIGDSALNYVKRGRTYALELPSG